MARSGVAIIIMSEVKFPSLSWITWYQGHSLDNLDVCCQGEGWGGGGGTPHSLSAFSELSSNSFKEAERINGGIIKQSFFELNHRGRSFVSDFVLSSAKVQQLRPARPWGDQEGSYCNPPSSAVRVASPHIHTTVPSQFCARGESRLPRCYFFLSVKGCI